MARVVHITSVHEALDNRILFKECTSLSSVGHEVYLIAQHKQDFTKNGVFVKAIKKPRNRFIRVMFTTWVCAIKAFRLRPDVLHYHDTELVLVGILSRILGIPTIFDVHENSKTSIRDKSYLGFFGFPLAMVVSWVENIARRFNYIIIAERSYETRFPNSTKVLNYPVYRPYYSISENSKVSKNDHVIYAGVAHELRGALIHANLVNLHPTVEVHLVGRMPADVRHSILDVAGHNSNRLHIEGNEKLVSFERIEELYASGKWSAGLAIFPYSPDLADKELTKFFEYMAAGIPILCSNFTLWKKLVEDQHCGICVNPNNEDSIAAGLEKLLGNPNLTEKLRANGRHLARKYTWDSQEENLLKLYERILGTESK